ncbi:MAG: von Willebrand factor type A domain-containing protein [Paludibacter sp.]|nr:von Willebrand factor type A domain-containing protein [Paludibacter sp.]
MNKIVRIFFFSILICLMSACNRDGVDQNYGIDSEDIAFNKEYSDLAENPFVKVEAQTISIVSTDVEGASYADVRQYINLGQTPPTTSVKVEDLINYFTYDYPEPVLSENISLSSEVTACPWRAGHYLMRIGLKGKSISESEQPKSNYVFLVDVSKSMNSPERLELLQSGLKLLLDNLEATDKISLITYSNQTKLVLKSTACDRKDEIRAAIDKLFTGGSGVDVPSLTYSYSVAMDNFIANGSNRVIMVSDGDLNVNPSSSDELVKVINEKRKSGVNLTVLGFGKSNPNNHLMEQIPNKGNGNYEYIDNLGQFMKVFVKEKAKFCPVAKNAKIQVKFNELKVDSFRLIGYEERAFKKEATDGYALDAEIGATQTITAIYEIVLRNLSVDEKIGIVDFTYTKPDEKQSRQLGLDIQAIPGEFNNASENMRFAVSVTAFGLLLKHSKYKGTATKQMVIDLGQGAFTFDPNGYRREFVSLVNMWTGE